jgi:hypothetical protein
MGRTRSATISTMPTAQAHVRTLSKMSVEASASWRVAMRATASSARRDVATMIIPLRRAHGGGRCPLRALALARIIPFRTAVLQ